MEGERQPRAEDWASAVRYVRNCYPIEAFPWPTTSEEGKAAFMARLTCDNIERLAREGPPSGSRRDGAARSQRRHLGPDLLAEVTKVAESHPEAPTKAVCLYFGTTPRTAARWIAAVHARAEEPAEVDLRAHDSSREAGVAMGKGAPSRPPTRR